MNNNISIQGKKNNLNFLRFLAASLVILSHSFPLTQGDNTYEPLCYISNTQETIGTISVKIFFIISGFLILMSWDRKKNLLQFLKARILRIFPGLIFSILLTILILGPIFTTCSLNDYFTNPETYKYLINISLRKLSNVLPGVFTNNIFPESINNSLWTLFFEFLCYLMIAFLGCTKLLKKAVVLILFSICYFVYTFPMYGGIFVKLGEFFSLGPIYMLTTYFCAGMLVYLYKDKIKLNLPLFIIATVALIISVFTDSMKFILPFALTYLIFYFSFNKKIDLSSFGSKTDLSYGIYIYAFPIQQAITYLFKNSVTWYINFLIAFPVTIILAYVSWNLIEKRFLNLKSKSYVVKEETLTA